MVGGYAGYGLLRVGFEVPRNSQVGRVAQPRTRLTGYAGYSLLGLIVCITIFVQSIQ